MFSITALNSTPRWNPCCSAHGSQNPFASHRQGPIFLLARRAKLLSTTCFPVGPSSTQSGSQRWQGGGLWSRNRFLLDGDQWSLGNMSGLTPGKNWASRTPSGILFRIVCFFCFGEGGGAGRRWKRLRWPGKAAPLEKHLLVCARKQV